jgi:hypothetical protein
MKKELQDKLFEKYPKIFRQKDLPMQETAMCWGIACGDGWYELIDNLCGEIQNRVDNVNRHRQYKIENSPNTIVPVKTEVFICEAIQVKEKFGGLCFYTYGGDDFTDGVISLAESMSYKICTVCGASNSRSTSNRGWIHTLCKSCRSEQVELTSKKVMQSHKGALDALDSRQDKKD